MIFVTITILVNVLDDAECDPREVELTDHSVADYFIVSSQVFALGQAYSPSLKVMWLLFIFALE